MKKILVIGDSCKDIFIYCAANRLCPDIPVPVLNVLYKTENDGMAKNVHRNIKNIIPDCDIITNDDWENITKTRYMHELTNHMFIRVDTEHKIKRIDLTKVNLSEYEIIVVSDYNKGFLTQDDIEWICSNHDCVFLDTKKVLGKWAENSKYIKINNFEYESSKNVLTEKLLEKLIHTKGGDGCIYKNTAYTVNKVDVKDSSGAGDSFMAGLVCKYIETKNIHESIIFANRCAEKAVQQKGVSVIKNE